MSRRSPPQAKGIRNSNSLASGSRSGCRKLSASVRQKPSRALSFSSLDRRLRYLEIAVLAIMKLAERMSRIGVESAFDVLVRARALEAEGREVIHLEIGEPDFATPAFIVEAAKAALDEGWTHYGPAQGLPELREAIAAEISATRGISVGAEHVCVVPGGKPILFFPMLALFKHAADANIPAPALPNSLPI